MRGELVSRLQTALPSISRDLVFADIAAPLIEKDILAPAEYQSVLAANSDSGRATILVDILCGKEDAAYNVFLDVLRADYSWLADAAFVVEEVGESSRGDVTDSVPIDPDYISHRCQQQLNAQNRTNVDLATCQNQQNERVERSNCCSKKATVKRRHSSVKLEPNKRLSTHGRCSTNETTTPVADPSPSNVITSVSSDSLGSTDTAPTILCDTPLLPTVPVFNTSITDVLSENDKNAKLSQGLTDEMLTLLKKNHRASRDWTSLAHTLGLSNLVHKIRTKVLLYGEDLDICIVHLLKEWKGEQPKTATLINLIHALRSEGFNDIADELKEKFAN